MSLGARCKLWYVLLPALPSFVQLQEQTAQLLKEKLLFTTSHPEAGKQLQLQRSCVHSCIFNRTRVGFRLWNMELFLVLALVVWAVSRNTGPLSKQLHLRILLRMRIGFKRNNHHKCLISQIQLILLCWPISFWLVGLTWLTLLSKEVPTYCSLETCSCSAGPEVGLSWHAVVWHWHR